MPSRFVLPFFRRIGTTLAAYYAVCPLSDEAVAAHYVSNSNPPQRHRRTEETRRLLVVSH